MTAREFESCINFVGMEKDLRGIAIRNNLDKIENIATMTRLDICELILNFYHVVFAENERIGLVKNEDIDAYNNIVKVASR